MIEQHEPPKNILHEYLFSLFPVDFFLSYETKYIKRMLENNIKSFHFTFLYALLQMIASHWTFLISVGHFQFIYHS